MNRFTLPSSARDTDFPLKGQVFMALVFLIAGIIAVVGVMLAFLANSSIDTGYGFQAATLAETAANSGVQDALLQLNRNPDFSNTSGYTVIVGGQSALVKVTQNSPSSGLVTVLSVATVSNHTKQIQVVVSDDPATTEISVVSWQEI